MTRRVVLAAVCVTLLFALPLPSAPVSKPGPPHFAALARLARVWGFLKYHHTGVTLGARDWDAALMQAVPRVLQDPDAAEAVMKEWAADLGEQPACDPCPSLDGDIHYGPDLAWMDDRKLDEDVRSYLRHVYERRDAEGWQWYVSLFPYVFNPDFSRENPYLGLEPDVSHRLLALFRYWNIVQYWYPYRNLIQDHWGGVLEEFIPRIMAAEDPLTFRRELNALVARLDDSHGILIPPPPSSQPQACILPVILRFVEGRVIVSAYSHPESGPATGLQPGDEIRAIDGTPVSTRLRELAPSFGASNEPRRLGRMLPSLAVGDCVEVDVLGWRPGGAFHLKPERMPLSQVDISGWSDHQLPGDEPVRLLGDDVGYMKISKLRAASARSYIMSVQGTRGLIIDIRSYPTDFSVFALGQYLVDSARTFALFTRGLMDNPGAFRWDSLGATLRPVVPHYWGQVVILVDETTQSSAEYHAMAFRAAPGAIVVGSTTAGADGNVSIVPLIGGYRTYITGIGVFYGDRTPTQQIGIVPDVEVHPTIEGIREGRDEVLETAIRLIREAAE